MTWAIVRRLAAGALLGVTLAARGDFPVSVGTQPAPPPPPAAATTNSADPNRLYTMDELRTAFRDQQYRVVLQQVSKIQPNKRMLADYNPYDLAMLKAEAYVGLHMNTQALDTFAQAAKIAPDAKANAVALATALLVRRSANLRYTLRHTPPPAAGEAPRHEGQIFELTNMAQRTEALAALYADELFEFRPKAAAAEKGMALPAIAQAGKTLADLALLELAATGQNSYTTQESTVLAGRARDLIKTSLDKMGPVVDTICKNADNFVQLDYPITDAGGRVIGYDRHYRKRGLLQNEPQIVRDIKANADKIEAAIGELGTLLHQDAGFFAAIAADARKISVQANMVLTTDYTAVDPPGSPSNRR